MVEPHSGVPRAMNIEDTPRSTRMSLAEDIVREKEVMEEHR